MDEINKKLENLSANLNDEFGKVHKNLEDIESWIKNTDDWAADVTRAHNKFVDDTRKEIKSLKNGVGILSVGLTITGFVLYSQRLEIKRLNDRIDILKGIDEDLDDIARRVEILEGGADDGK